MRTPWELDKIITEVNKIRKDILRVLYDRLDELETERKESAEKHSEDMEEQKEIDNPMADQKGAYDSQ